MYRRLVLARTKVLDIHSCSRSLCDQRPAKSVVHLVCCICLTRVFLRPPPDDSRYREYDDCQDEQGQRALAEARQREGPGQDDAVQEDHAGHAGREAAAVGPPPCADRRQPEGGRRSAQGAAPPPDHGLGRSPFPAPAPTRLQPCLPQQMALFLPRPRGPGSRRGGTTGHARPVRRPPRTGSSRLPRRLGEGCWTSDALEPCSPGAES